MADLLTKLHVCVMYARMVGNHNHALLTSIQMMTFLITPAT